MNLFALIVLLWLFTFGISNNGLITTALTIIVYMSVIVFRYLRSSWFRKRYQESDYDKEHLDLIEGVMKSPKGISIVDYEERIRRNLLVVSIAAIAFTWLSLEVNTAKPFFGSLTFKNLTQRDIYGVFFVVLVYEFLHYFWIQINNFGAWRVRLTGITIPEVRGDGGPARMGGENSPTDFSGNDNNTNFYTWMFENKNDRTTAMTQLLKMSEELQSLVSSMQESQGINAKQIQEFSAKINSISSSIERLERAMKNIRIDGSMLRFDQWFRVLVASQNLRWLILDIALPFILGLVALYSLVTEL